MTIRLILPPWLAAAFLLVIPVAAAPAAAATLVYAEYFVDVDPGQGSGTSVLPCDGVFNSAEEDFCLENIPVPSLPVGRHTLFLRLRDSDNHWFTRKTDFFIGAARLAAAEYFFDVDPGVGAGIDLLPCDGVFDEVEEDFCLENIPVPDLPAGRHSLFLRLTDADGNVTLRHTPCFIRVPLESAEYYVDDDPGEGNGVSVPAQDGTFDEVEENLLASDIATDALSYGQHLVYLRLRDQEGRWAQRSVPLFVSYADPFVPNIITAAEYSLDGGPWQMMDAADGFFGDPEEWLSGEFIIPTDLSFGDHTVAVRAQDNFGNWGIAKSRSFKVWEFNPYKTLIGAEFFADVDPGEGNGTPLVAVDSVFNESIEDAGLDSVSTAFFELGVHQIYVRFRDNYQDSLGFVGWGPADARPLQVVDNFGFECGDFSGSNQIDITDAVYLVNYIFAGGPPPADPSGGDIDCSGRTDIGDAVYLINYIFVVGSPEPCAACP